MACRVFKKVLGYEICVLDKEGTLFRYDAIILIRRSGFTEVFNLDNMRHEIGDVIKQEETRKEVYGFIMKRKNELMELIDHQ